MTYQPTYERTYGSNYEETKDLDVVEVAKRIKKELRSEFPGFKWSVRTQKYSGGQSIRVEIKDAPESVQLYNPEWLQEVEETGRLPYRVEKYSPVATAVLKSAERLVESYNFDGSDAMVDYFDVRFYKSVEYARSLEEARREDELASSEADENDAEEPEALEATQALKDEKEELEAKLAAARARIAALDAEIADIEDLLS